MGEIIFVGSILMISIGAIEMNWRLPTRAEVQSLWQSLTPRSKCKNYIHYSGTVRHNVQDFFCVFKFEESTSLNQCYSIQWMHSCVLYAQMILPSLSLSLFCPEQKVFTQPLECIDTKCPSLPTATITKIENGVQIEKKITLSLKPVCRFSGR